MIQGFIKGQVVTEKEVREAPRAQQEKKCSPNQRVSQHEKGLAGEGQLGLNWTSFYTRLTGSSVQGLGSVRRESI